MVNHDPVAFGAAARDVGFLGFGFYPRSGFIHVDLQARTSVGRAVPGPGDCLRRRNANSARGLADSRTMKGGGAAGVATLGAAGVEVAQGVLAETQTAILPLVPYLDTCAGCSSPWLSAGSQSRSTPGSTTGSGGVGDRRAAHRVRRQPVDAGGAALRRHRPRRAPVPAVDSAVRRASGTPRRTP